MKIHIFLQVYMLHLDKPVNVIAKPIDQYDKKKSISTLCFWAQP